MVETLYFTAAWCGPCRSMAPAIAELQREGHVITKIDVDQQRDIAQKWGILAMPTFIILRDDQQIRRFTGARNKASLLAEIRAVENG